MQQSTLDFLRSTANFFRYAKDEYICYEGQAGREMYIVLQGAVGVYLTDISGKLMEVSRIESGGFFGEMAIFDKFPRSASCIALEETICVAINQNNLSQFLTNCPDIVEQMLMSMSLRVRKMDEMLHRTQVTKAALGENTAFDVPPEFYNHCIEAPAQDPKLLQAFKEECPVCGEEIPVIRVRRNLLSAQLTTPDQRTRYADCEPLWYDVITCPHCLYSNYYLNFFNVNKDNRAAVRLVLEEQYPVASKLNRYATAVDRVLLAYLQAIHLNERLHASDNALLGILWLRLYWLACSGNDSPMVVRSAQNAAKYLAQALDLDQITNPADRYSLALSTAYLLERMHDPERAKKYCAMVLNCPNTKLRSLASALANRL